MKSLKKVIATLLIIAAVACFGTAMAESTHTADYSDPHTVVEDGVTTTTNYEEGIHDSVRNSYHGMYVTKDTDGNTIIGDGINYMAAERYTAASDSVSVETENAKGSMTMSVGTVEAKAGFQAGTYQKVDKDGKVSTGVGVKAEAGASAYAVEVKAEGRYGTDDNNVKGEVDLKGIGAETNVGVECGIVNGELAVKGEAGAEANLVTVKGTVSGTVAGVETKMTATGKVGVGVKAKAEYKDGKLEMELGAALGIGGSVSVSVDVDAVADKAVDGANALSDLVNGRELNPLYGEAWKKTTTDDGVTVKTRSVQDGNYTCSEYKTSDGISLHTTSRSYGPTLGGFDWHGPAKR